MGRLGWVEGEVVARRCLDLRLTIVVDSSTLMTVRTGGDTSCLDSSTTTTTDPFMPVSIITQIETKTAVAPGFTDGNSNGNDSTKNDGQAS